MEKCSLILIVVCIVVTLTVLILLLSMDTIDPLQYGITLNKISKAVGTETFENGRYIIGPFNSFIRYPANLVTVEFSDSRTADAGPLQTRTNEGLALSLCVSYQYRLEKKNITALYNLASINYAGTLNRISRDTILKVGSAYMAEDYWIDRKKIGDKMKDQLNIELQKVFANCTSFQLLRIDLPQTYEDSIVQTQVENQKINMREFEQQAELIRQNISVNAQAQIRVTNSSGEAEAYRIKQNAQSTAINKTITNQANVYSNIQKDIGLAGDDLNQYLYLNSLNDQKNAKLLVGMQNSILSFGNTPIQK
jgi:regulator of protease activity HflC (stomatin/prohibitin superfamily)